MMQHSQTKNIDRLNRIKACKEMINESKLELVKKKMLCESAVLEYLEKMMQIEENKLNQQLRNLTKLHHNVLKIKNHDPTHPKSENQSLYKIENEINYLESIIKNYQKDMNNKNNNSLFSTISIDWLESSIYLQDKLNKHKQQNDTLKSQIDKIENTKTNTIETSQNDINHLQNECDEIKKENENLKNILKEKENIQNDIKKTLYQTNEENKSLKINISKLYKQSMEQLMQIKSTLTSSNPITLKINDEENLDYIDNKENDNVDSIELMNDLYKTLCNVSEYNINFITQQNKLCNEIKNESAKLLSVLEIKNIENEKNREEEIKNLIEETRSNLEREYGEYNSFCDKKVEDIKNECIKYRENVLKEAKEQIIDKKKNFETAKNLMRERYEEEILSIKKIYDNKNKKLMNDIEMLHKKLINEKTKHEIQINDKIEECNKIFQDKIMVKEKEFQDRVKVIDMRYQMKMDELIKKNDDKINIQRSQFKIQQELLQNEIENLTNNFKKEIQILKRFKPHHIVHVPLNNNNQINNESSYSSQLQDYITANTS